MCVCVCERDSEKGDSYDYTSYSQLYKGYLHKRNAILVCAFNKVWHPLWLQQLFIFFIALIKYRNDVCSSVTEIPNWWCKICLQSVQELWLVDVVFILFKLSFTSDRQNTKGYKVQNYVNVMILTTKWNLWNLFLDLMNLSFAGAHL